MKKEIVLDYIMRGVMFTFIVGGLAHSLLFSLALPFPVWFTFTLTAAFYVVLTIFLWNFWTSVLFLPVSALTVLIYAHYFLPEYWFEEILVNLDLMVTYVAGYGYLDYSSMLSLAVIAIALLSLMFYALAILLEWFFPTLITGIFLIGLLWYIGHFGILLYVWPFAFGMILMLAEKFRQNVNNGNQTANYGRWQLSALPLAIAVTLTALSTLPADTRNLRWYFLEEAALDVNDALWDLFEPAESRSGFRLWQTGFAPTTGPLGGPVTLNHEIALHVVSPARVLLRGAVLNDYTGYGWNDTIDDRALSFGAQHPDSVKDMAFDTYEPMFTDLDHGSREQLLTRFNVQVSHTGIVTSVLFNANRISRIALFEDASYAYFNMTGEAFAQRVIKPQEPYRMEVMSPNVDSLMFKNKIDQMPSIDWLSSISREISSQYGLNHRKLLNIQRYYTRLPDTVSDRVRELTQEVIREADTPFEKAIAIEEFLENNFGYTLRPPHTPDNVDFVDHFLFNLRVGYCTYFATAMAVMGRIAGLPTRYVEGFLMPPEPVEDDLYEIRQSNAHAWVEVYFPGAGWLTFDPTPPIEVYFAEHGIIPGVTDGVFYDDYMQDYWEMMQQMWMSQNPGAPGMPVTPPAINYDENREGTLLDFNPLTFLLLFIAVLLGIIALLLCVFAIWLRIKNIKRDKLPYRKRLKSYFQEIIWLLTLYEYPIKSGETPYAYAGRVDSWLVNDAGSMMDIAGILIRSEFGYDQLTDYDINLVGKFHKNLLNSIKYVLGRHKYYAALILREINNNGNQPI